MASWSLSEYFPPLRVAYSLGLFNLTVSPGSGKVDFGIIAQGRTVDHKLVPIDTIGVAVKFMGKNADVSVGAKSVFPDGKIRQIGQNVEVMISGSIRF